MERGEKYEENYQNNLAISKGKRFNYNVQLKSRMCLTKAEIKKTIQCILGVYQLISSFGQANYYLKSLALRAFF